MIIYKITNKINGKVYIGQTSRKSVNRRFYEHCHKSSGCVSLHRAIEKYGRKNFTIEQIDIACDRDELDAKEVYWIEFYNSLVPFGYNLKTGGHKAKYSLLSRKKMSKNHADVSGKNNPRYGVKVSEYTKGLIRACQLGRKHSKEEKLKVQFASPKRKEVVKVESGEIYLSTRDAELKNNLSHGCVSRVCRGEGLTAGGYHWRYVK